MSGIFHKGTGRLVDPIYQFAVLSGKETIFSDAFSEILVIFN